MNPKQAHVLNALVSGASITAAAQAAGVDRSTVYAWQRTIPAFNETLDKALAERADNLREAMVDLSKDALATVRQILTSNFAPPSVRLKAALKILDTAQRTKIQQNPTESNTLFKTAA